MPENHILLERIQLNDSVASVTFANIPQSGYTDLKIVVSARCTQASISRSLGLYINSFVYPLPSTSNRGLIGNGSTATSVTATDYVYAGEIPGSSATANTFSNTEIYIPNYSGSTFKSISTESVAENNATTATITLYSGLVSNTAAISSIFIDCASTFVANSTFSLYGIADLGTTPTIAPKASGGNIDYDGTYWIHTFLTSGIFTPDVPLTCDYLVIAGGGGGGGVPLDNAAAGGGGAGGYRTSLGTSGGGAVAESSISAAAIPYTITVGAGGVGGAGNAQNNGTNGSSSTFSTITSQGGGFGGFFNGGAGGSGGGARYGGAGGAPTSGQGFAGGSHTINNANFGAAGGGGAGAVGVSNVTSAQKTGGAGGAGVASTISGTSVTRAGGGGGGSYTGSAGVAGGAGGSGGGAAGATSGSNAVAAIANFGGGGGGGSPTSSLGSAGGNGGSGIVIIRYPR